MSSFLSLCHRLIMVVVRTHPCHPCLGPLWSLVMQFLEWRFSF